jgi:hypothetical protein
MYSGCSSKTKKNSPFSVFRAQEYLSPRALERRQKQGLSIDQSDLPVNPFYIDSVLTKGFQLHSQSKWLNGIAIISPQGIKTPHYLKNLKGVKDVQAIGFARKTQAITDSMGPRDYRQDYPKKEQLLRQGKKPNIYAERALFASNGLHRQRPSYCHIRWRFFGYAPLSCF